LKERYINSIDRNSIDRIEVVDFGRTNLNSNFSFLS